jgi:hypothetical protein
MAIGHTSIVLDSITSDTVEFIKRVIADSSAGLGAWLMPWQSGARHPVDQLHDVFIGKERCNLEYPGLGFSSHFHSGFRILVRQRQASVFLDFIPDHNNGIAVAALDLRQMQDLLFDEKQQRRKLADSVTAALDAETRLLIPYRRS